MTGAYLSEIFQSVQGEGPLAGLPFLFVRFCGCNLDCSYCDTKWSKSIMPKCRIHSDDRKTAYLPNPVHPALLIKTLSAYSLRYMTFTGGEPLLHSGFIESVIPLLESKIILMETNGTLSEKVTPVLLKRIDYWSADIKLPSVAGENHFKEHRTFGNKMASAKNVIFKAVFSPRTPASELKTAFDLAYGVFRKNRSIQLVYQPLTRNGRIVTGNNMRTILGLAEKSPMDVRVLPQLHKILKVR